MVTLTSSKGFEIPRSLLPFPDYVEVPRVTKVTMDCLTGTPRHYSRLNHADTRTCYIGKKEIDLEKEQ